MAPVSLHAALPAHDGSLRFTSGAPPVDHMVARWQPIPLLPLANEVWGRHLSVSHSVHRGRRWGLASQHASQVTWSAGGLHLGEGSASRGAASRGVCMGGGFGQTPLLPRALLDTFNKRVVRILLECILDHYADIGGNRTRSHDVSMKRLSYWGSGTFTELMRNQFIPI